MVEAPLLDVTAGLGNFPGLTCNTTTGGGGSTTVQTCSSTVGGITTVTTTTCNGVGSGSSSCQTQTTSGSANTSASGLARTPGGTERSERDHQPDHFRHHRAACELRGCGFASVDQQRGQRGGTARPAPAPGVNPIRVPGTQFSPTNLATNEHPRCRPRSATAA